jgi:L-ascorbate metabolism protein UlaG (beta-lactamase superfamily)
VTTAPNQLTWVGHSTVLLELGGVRLLTDPVLRGRLGYLRRHGPPPASGVTERLDAVLISHQHLDHLDVPSLRRLDRDVEVLAPAGAGPRLRRLGFVRVTELVVAEGADVRGVRVRAVPAHHDSRRHRLAAAAVALGFIVEGTQTIYFAGDTDLFDGMSGLAEHLDVALLPVWGWGPSLGSGHMDPLTAARAAALLRPRLAVPIHWGTLFPVGLERLRAAALVEPPRVFARHAARLAPGVDVRVLAPGGTLRL